MLFTDKANKHNIKRTLKKKKQSFDVVTINIIIAKYYS